MESSMEVNVAIIKPTNTLTLNLMGPNCPEIGKYKVRKKPSRITDHDAKNKGVGYVFYFYHYAKKGLLFLLVTYCVGKTKSIYNVKYDSKYIAGVVGWCESAMYLVSLGRPTDIGLQLGKACCPCSR